MSERIRIFFSRIIFSFTVMLQIRCFSTILINNRSICYREETCTFAAILGQIRLTRPGHLPMPRDIL